MRPRKWMQGMWDIVQCMWELIRSYNILNAKCCKVLMCQLGKAFRYGHLHSLDFFTFYYFVGDNKSLLLMCVRKTLFSYPVCFTSDKIGSHHYRHCWHPIDWCLTLFSLFHFRYTAIESHSPRPSKINKSNFNVSIL